MTKRPRFARVVGRGFLSGQARPQDLIEAQDAMKLLQREHAAVVRKVKAMGRGVSISQFGNSNECYAYRQACADLLAWLDERGR